MQDPLGEGSAHRVDRRRGDVACLDDHFRVNFASQKDCLGENNACHVDHLHGDAVFRNARLAESTASRLVGPPLSNTWVHHDHHLLRSGTCYDGRLDAHPHRRCSRGHEIADDRDDDHSLCLDLSRVGGVDLHLGVYLAPDLCLARAGCTDCLCYLSCWR